MQGFRRNPQNKIAGDQNAKIQTAGLVSTPQTTWNPAHRRPWLKMRIEYHPPLIFNAFCEEFSSCSCLHILWLNSIGKLGKWCFRLRETMIFIVFGNDVTTLSMQGLVFFSSSDSINPAAAGPPSVPRILSGCYAAATSLCMGGVGGDINVHVPCLHTWMLCCCYVTGHGWGSGGY